MNESSDNKPGKWIFGGGLLAALGASLCCFGPALFVALGLGSFTAAGYFESIRPYLLGVAGIFLALAWYRAFLRKRKNCASGETDLLRGGSQAQKISVVLVTFLMAGFAAYPQLSTLAYRLTKDTPAQNNSPVSPSSEFTGPDPAAAGTLAKASGEATLEVDIPSMYCPACATGIESALAKKPGILDARIDFSSKSGKIVYNKTLVTPEQLMAAIDAAGFKAERKK